MHKLNSLKPNWYTSLHVDTPIHTTSNLVCTAILIRAFFFIFLNFYMQVRTGEKQVKGLHTYRYKFMDNDLDNGANHSENKCFCRQGRCLKPGLIDVTDCYYGALLIHINCLTIATKTGNHHNECQSVHLSRLSDSTVLSPLLRISPIATRERHGPWPWSWQTRVLFLHSTQIWTSGGSRFQVPDKYGTPRHQRHRECRTILQFCSSTSLVRDCKQN